MKIKEGSIIKIIDGNDMERPIVENIIAQDDISIDGKGEGYSFLLRREGYDSNCIFESDIIYEFEGEYIVEGYFKDAVLVIANTQGNEMHESYMDYDN